MNANELTFESQYNANLWLEGLNIHKIKVRKICMFYPEVDTYEVILLKDAEGEECKASFEISTLFSRDILKYALIAYEYAGEPLEPEKEIILRELKKVATANTLVSIANEYALKVDNENTTEEDRDFYDELYVSTLKAQERLNEAELVTLSKTELDDLKKYDVREIPAETLIRQLRVACCYPAHCSQKTLDNDPEWCSVRHIPSKEAEEAIKNLYYHLTHEDFIVLGKLYKNGLIDYLKR
jgi:hypothetical protein